MLAGGGKPLGLSKLLSRFPAASTPAAAINGAADGRLSARGPLLLTKATSERSVARPRRGRREFSCSTLSGRA